MSNAATSLPEGSITRTVEVDRSKTPLEVFKDITSHKHYFDESIVAEMPLGTEEVVELVFIPIKKVMSCNEYALFLESHGLKPDPVAQAIFNQENPKFSDNHPNNTQWLNKAGKFCYGLWDCWLGYPGVFVYECSDDWLDYWFACGAHK